MFRNPSYQVEASAGRSPTLNQGPNTAQATFADMARSGLTPRTPDISSREQPTSPEALSDNPSVESGSGIVKLRPTSRVKVPKAWKTLELDCR
jgi:hypothetical protein